MATVPAASSTPAEGPNVGFQSTHSSEATAPSVPTRPASLAPSVTPNVVPYSNPLTTQFNASPYGSAYSSYGSPYNRLGTYGGMGTYGSYGMGGYGGFGNYGMGGYGGIGGYGMGYNGMGMPPPMYDPTNASLTQHLEATTQSTFTLLHSIVQTFGGFAQMLESTFMATHSSFFAMVGVAEQFGQLRNALGAVLGLFGMIRWLKSLITGLPPDGLMRDEFGNFINRPPGAPPVDPNAPRPSKKPLIAFLLAIVGLPFLMHRLIRHLSSRLPAPQNLNQPIDPTQYVFARATYAFNTKNPVELGLRAGEIVAILRTTDPVTGVESEWWRGRTRDGREGWFPKAYVEIINGNPAQTEAKPV
ncbi:hypothetical protein M422DRAFT_28071 [Sphaerobolus stellatus SS14]|nr:hypothetical protein M422DRAFT_28071 [Sphaerobolus stellatus SS14]